MSKKVEVSVRGINISAVVAENEIKITSQYRSFLTFNGIYPDIDSKSIFKECEKLYSEILNIGIKDKYSDEEINDVNAFFGISTFVNYKSSNIIGKVKANFTTTNLAISGHPHSIYTFNNKATGFKNIYKSVSFTDENWIDFNNICKSKCNMTIAKLNGDEIKQFIEYCQLHTFSTFNLIVASYK